jgi:hypothetical protein
MISDCGRRDSCITVTFLPAPDPDAGPDQIICGQATNFEGTIDYPGGQWTQVSGPNMANITNVLDINSPVDVSKYGLFQFVWSETNLDCNGTDTVDILFRPDPLANNIDTICSSDATSFNVTFEINRGQPPYTIVQGGGTITNDSFYMSDVILDNTPTTIVIQDDYGCEFTYFIDHDCICLNAPGDIAQDTIKNCGPDEIVCGDYDITNQELEAPKDTFMYVLYSQLGMMEQSLLDFNHTGCFSFDPATMMMDVVYYIGVAVGRKDGNNYVDWDGGCLQLVEAQPVIWYTIPTPDAGPDMAVCGQAMNLNGTISIGGSIYRWLNTAGVSISTPGDLQTGISVSQFGTYEMVLQEVNAICPATDTVLVTFNESPSGSPEEICVDFVNFEFIVTFEITAGTPPYTIIQGGGTIDPATNVYTSGNLPSLVPYTIIIEDANGCQFIVNDQHNCDCGNTDPGIMDGLAEACIDECIDICSNGTEVLQPDEEAFFILHTGSGTVIQGELDRKKYDHTANPCEIVTFCFDPATMTPGVTYYVSRLIQELNNPDDPCNRVSPGKPLIWHDYPTSDAGPDMDFCGLDGTLSATPSLGSGTWTMVSGPGSAIFAGALASQMVTVDAYGTYTFRWTEDNNTCTDNDDVQLTFHDAPTVSNIQYICDDVAENYVITFEINNGEQATYIVTGIQGTLNGNVFTSDPIPSGGSANFCVTDQWDCQPDCIDTSHECECITEPGSLTGDDILCIDECVQVVHVGGTLDANDILRYVLHDGTANSLGGTIIECNDNGEFCFDPFAMTPNTMYFITALAGNPDMTGCVDLTERCAVVTEGIPVTWFEYPVPTISQSEPLFTCEIDSMILDGTASSGPGALTYQWTTINGQFCASSVQTNATVVICAPGTYILTVTHAESGCATSDTVVIEADENIPAVEAGPERLLTCDVTSVILDGTGTETGSDLEVTWFDENDNALGNTLQITVTEPGTYRIYVLNTETNCDNFATVIVSQDIEQPIAAIDQLGVLTCSVDEISLSGANSITKGGVRSYTWSTTNGNISGSTSNQTTTVTEQGVYQLIIIDDLNGCADTIDINVDEIGNTLARFDITALPPTCFGDVNGQIVVDSTYGGDEPFVYSFEGGPFTSSNVFNNLAPGDYRIRVRDANGCEMDTIITVLATPQIGIETKEDLFKEAGADVDMDTLILRIFGVDPMDADSIVWYDDETGERYGINPSILDSITRKYDLRVELWDNGCVDVDFITIFVKFTRRVYIPNVIVPTGSSGNRENKYLTLHANKNRVKTVNFLRVYDRWGELIYSEDEIPYSERNGYTEVGWDGTFNGELMNPGVFVYHFQVEFHGGVVEDYFGDVTLLLVAE